MAAALICTGGTAAWSHREGRMLSGPELSDLAGTKFDSIVDLRSVPSWDLRLRDMLELSARVRAAAADGHRAIVVTHGTDTLEESAWLTDLLLSEAVKTRSRVIFTGAMRFADAEDSDGPDNVRFALQTALATDVMSHCVQVAFAGELHAARWVRKVDALSMNPFSSGDRPSSSGPLPSTGEVIDENVAVVVANALIRQPIPHNPHGVILCGTGAGHVPSAYIEVIEDLWSRGVPVVIASRARDVARPYQEGQRTLWAADLTPEKAALALMAALGVSSELVDVCSWWSELMAGSIR